jgi:hypothetical protein
MAGNEWLENKHGKQYIRRTWKKLHIVVGDHGMILANSTTDHNKDDRSQIAALMKNIKTKDFLGDPGYNGQNIYQLLKSRGITPIIRSPNRKTIKSTTNSTTKPPKEPKTDRHQSALYQETHGYQAWRVKNDYGRREKVENTFFRFKTNFGSKFSSREDNNMQNEMTIKCDLLNRMFKIGKPISVRAS